MLYGLVSSIALLYSMVGFGGATGYLAAMSFFSISPQIMASTALILNIGVAGISFVSFFRSGHLKLNMAWPFLITSIPAAFIGGFYKISDQTYSILLYTVLSFVAIRLLLFSNKQVDEQELRPVPMKTGLIVGLMIGLISGMVGIGGGIFLSPIILFARWGNSKQAAAVAAAFIVLNSISGLIGRLLGENFLLDSFGLSLIPFGLGGALLGSVLGAIKLSNTNLRRAVGMVMSIAVTSFWWSVWR